MTGNNPLIPDGETVRRIRRLKANPLRSLTPARLAGALEAFEQGHLREAGLLFEVIAERDDTLKSVKPKREKEVAALPWHVVTLPDRGDDGETHRAILDEFWRTARCVNTIDRNQRGGFRRLVKQMQSAVSFRYSAHHIVWQSVNGTLRATFEFVPTWLFENTRGVLRYLRDPMSAYGEELDPGECMIAAGDGLMIACSIGYQAKRNAFNDWLIFSEKFSVPGILGRTKHDRDSPEGRAMRNAVQSFGHDWVAVIYGDDNTHAKPIDIIQATGNPAAMPMPELIDRIDRKFAAIYRGADLSTMSAGQGAGSGASLQGKESVVLLCDDAETINETLAEVSRKVIEWHFGHGTEPAAKVELVTPTDKDSRQYLASVKAMHEAGVRINAGAVLNRLGIRAARPDELALGETALPGK